MSRENERSHWDRLAQNFHKIGSPMRPSESDTKLMEAVVSKWNAEDSQNGPKVLLCGVTSEIATMTWPGDTELLAIDQSEAMRRLVWPGDIEGRRRVEPGDWLKLPQPDGWFDAVVGDGCFSCMPYPNGYRALAASLQRVLKKPGLLLMRFFVRPETGEGPQEVFRDLLAGQIGSFSAFRWRLTMALQKSPEAGVRSGEVWKSLVDAGLNWDTVAASKGWPIEALQATVLKDDTSFSFPTLEEVRAALSDHFETIAVHVARYELAERCPTVSFRPI